MSSSSPAYTSGLLALSQSLRTEQNLSFREPPSHQSSRNIINSTPFPIVIRLGMLQNGKRFALRCAKSHCRWLCNNSRRLWTSGSVLLVKSVINPYAHAVTRIFSFGLLFTGKGKRFTSQHISLYVILKPISSNSRFIKCWKTYDSSVFRLRRTLRICVIASEARQRTDKVIDFYHLDNRLVKVSLIRRNVRKYFQFSICRLPIQIDYQLITRIKTFPYILIWRKLYRMKWKVKVKIHISHVSMIWGFPFPLRRIWTGNFSVPLSTIVCCWK